MSYQTPNDITDRTDHVWYRRGIYDYKCCLCGAVTEGPPLFPTDQGFEPDRYETLTDEERAMVALPPKERI